VKKIHKRGRRIMPTIVEEKRGEIIAPESLPEGLQVKRKETAKKFVGCLTIKADLGTTPRKILEEERKK
jgi:hypothetical protein